MTAQPVFVADFEPQRGSPETAHDFDALLASVLDVAYRTAYHLARNSADAEDLVQEAALLACRHKATFQTGTNFKAWFLRILTNVFYSRCRKASVTKECVSLDDAPEPRLSTMLGNEMMAASTDPAQSFTDRLDAEMISRAIAALPIEYRVVTTMYLVDDMAYQDIAETLKIPVGTVRSRLHRGRRLLQRDLLELANERGLNVVEG